MCVVKQCIKSFVVHLYEIGTRHIHMYTCMHTHTHMHTHMYTHTCTYMYTHTCTHPQDSRSSQHRTCVPCALLLTTNQVVPFCLMGVVSLLLGHSHQIHVLQEDWSNETVKLVTSCEITDVCEISTDSGLPFYCTIVSH